MHCPTKGVPNRFLAEINNESKVRRSTGSEVVGKAKVMLWQDIENTRKELAAKQEAKAAKKAEREDKKAQMEAKKAEQAAKKAAKEAQREAEKAASKSTRGRKRKAHSEAADASEPRAKSPRMGEVLDLVVPQMDWLSEEQRIAPVARMI